MPILKRNTMKKLITTALIILASLAQAQDCPPPKHCTQICNELQTTAQCWDKLSAKDKAFFKNITLSKYGEIDPLCLRNREAREFLIKLKIK
jgi:hypothetical protein